MALMVKVVLATLIDYAHEIVLGSSRIRENPIDFAGDQ